MTLKSEPSLEDMCKIYEGPKDGDEIIAYTNITRAPKTLEVAECGVTLDHHGKLATLVCEDCDGELWEILPIDILHWAPK